MDTLRTLSLAFLTVFVFTPAFAQTTFNATSGSMVIHPGDQGVPYTVAGPDFSASGDIVGPGDNPFDLPIPPISGPSMISGDTAAGDLSMLLTVRGVPWSYPVGTTADGGATAQFLIPDLLLTHPGIFSFPFDFGGSFRGRPTSVAPPGVGCDVIMCTTMDFSGGGMVTLDVVASTSVPGSFQVTQATYTFEAPTPSTVSLMLLGLAALGSHLWARTCANSGFNK
jgi:hypothetical protein